MEYINDKRLGIQLHDFVDYCIVRGKVHLSFRNNFNVVQKKVFQFDNQNKVFGQLKYGIFTKEELDNFNTHIPQEVQQYKDFLKKENHDEGDQSLHNNNLIEHFLEKMGSKCIFPIFQLTRQRNKSLWISGEITTMINYLPDEYTIIASNVTFIEKGIVRNITIKDINTVYLDERNHDIEFYKKNNIPFLDKNNILKKL